MRRGHGDVGHQQPAQAPTNAAPSSARDTLRNARERISGMSRSLIDGGFGPA